MNPPSDTAKGPFKPPYDSKKRPCPTATVTRIPVRDADMERLLERLDRIGRDVEQLAVAIADRLGLDLEECSSGEDDSEPDTDEVDSGDE